MENPIIALLVRFEVPAAQQAGFKKATEPLIAASRAEPGNLQYDFYEAAQNQGIVLVFEKWRDQQAFNTHVETPHFKAFAAQFPGVMQKATQDGITPLQPLYP